MSHTPTTRRYKGFSFQTEGFGEYIDGLDSSTYKWMEENYYNVMPNPDCILFEYQVYSADYCLFSYICSNPHAVPARGLRGCCFYDWLTNWFNAEAQEAWQQDNPSAAQRPGPRRHAGPQSADEPTVQESAFSDMSLMYREMEFERHSCLYDRHRAANTTADAPTTDSPSDVPRNPSPSPIEEPTPSSRRPRGHAPLSTHSRSPSPPPSRSPSRSPSPHSQSPSPTRSDASHSPSRSQRRRRTSVSSSGSDSDASSTGGTLGPSARSRGRSGSRSPDEVHSGDEDESPVSPGVIPPWGTPSRDSSRPPRGNGRNRRGPFVPGRDF